MKSLVNKPPVKQSINASAFHVSTISVIHDCRSRLHQICFITLRKDPTSRANTIIMLRTTLRTVALRPLEQTVRLSSTASNPESSQPKAETSEQKKGQDQEKPAPKKKTMAELDEELRLKMSGLAGDGGEAGVELEGGQVCSTNGCIPEFMLLTHCPARLDEEECQREHVSLYLILSGGKKKDTTICIPSDLICTRRNDATLQIQITRTVSAAAISFSRSRCQPSFGKAEIQPLKT